MWVLLILLLLFLFFFEVCILFILSVFYLYFVDSCGGSSIISCWVIHLLSLGFNSLEVCTGDNLMYRLLKLWLPIEFYWFSCLYFQVFWVHFVHLTYLHVYSCGGSNTISSWVISLLNESIGFAIKDWQKRVCSRIRSTNS